MPSGITKRRMRDGESRSQSDIFDGPVDTAAIGELADARGCRAAHVRFQPGSHTRYHVHDSEQILIVVEGRGHIGSVEEDFVVVPGDVVRIPAGVEHYHGAGTDTPMAHIALLAGTTEIVDRSLTWPPAQ